MFELVLLRHGESIWNLENRFTGWTNVELTDNGKDEALKAGLALKKNGFSFDIIFTSVLKRANDTMDICLEQMNLKNPIINYEWRLNERHYGNLQGLNKSETAKKHGEEQVLIWRRSFDIAPPPLSIDDHRHPRFDKKYKNLQASYLPSSESLKDTIQRFMPLWYNKIEPQIKLNNKVLIVAHGNSLRALVKYLDKISKKDILNINIPTGVPLVYKLDNQLNSIKNYYIGDEEDISRKISLIKSHNDSIN
jgi:2,3-bisphosphoglycerate-dependent phosphoglycerate mutase